MFKCLITRITTRAYIRSGQESLTILAAFATTLSNLYPQCSFNNQLNPHTKIGNQIFNFEKSEDCSSRFSEKETGKTQNV